MYKRLGTYETQILQSIAYEIPGYVFDTNTRFGYVFI
jgi:hypothetical protein